MPPFLTWSLSRARAAVVPGAPTRSNPISSRISATESPIAGVGAKDRSMIPKGMFRRLEASLATSCPTRVILKAVFLIVSQRISKLSPLTDSRAVLTTPGPETPTLIIASASVTPWKAPAIKGLSYPLAGRHTAVPFRGRRGSSIDGTTRLPPDTARRQPARLTGQEHPVSPGAGIDRLDTTRSNAAGRGTAGL